MAKITITAVGGKRVKSGADAYDEFAAANVPWKEPGFVYRWLDREPRVIFERKRQGWKICDLVRDFKAKGCPDHLMPVTDVTGTEIIFGESILAKMPISLYEKRYRANVLEKVKSRREGLKEVARAAGDDAARELAKRGVTVKGDLVEDIGRGEIQRDWDSPRNVTSRDGRHVRDPNYEAPTQREKR